MDPQGNPTPGDNAAPPVAPAAPAAPADPQGQPPQQPAPTGSEPDNNSGAPQDPAMVPSDRLREETEKRRKAEEEAQQLREQLSAKQTPPADQDEDEELAPDVEQLLDSYTKKRGLVSQAELQQERLRIQVEQDVKDLEAHYANSGVPYDHRAVLEYANSNNIPIQSKAALDAAYRTMNWDKLLEVERQRTIAGIQGNGGGAERPGSAGAQPPAEPEIKGKSPKERTRERIRLAREKLAAG